MGECEPQDVPDAEAVGHTFAASRARQTAQNLDAVLDLAGVNDETQREQAHAAFLLAFPISYRRWRSNRLNRQPEGVKHGPDADGQGLQRS